MDGLYPVGTGDDASAGCKQCQQYQFFYSIGIGTGGIEYGYAHFCAFLNGDIVCACTGTGNRQKALVQFHAVHIKTAQDDTMGVVCIVVNDEVFFGQFCQTCCGDII